MREEERGREERAENREERSIKSFDLLSFLTFGLFFLLTQACLPVFIMALLILVLVS